MSGKVIDFFYNLFFPVDTCPQRYDTGVNPYEKMAKIYVLGAATSLQYSLLTLCLLLFAYFVLR